MAKKTTTLTVIDNEGNESKPIDMGALAAQLDTYSNITIKKAKIKDSNFLEVEYEERVLMGHNDVKKTCDAIVHDDMKNAFAKLSQHIENICELPNHTNISAKGFTIGGSGDHEGVCLFGSSSLDLGVMNIVTPFIKWDGDYSYASELGQVIEECKAEVTAYLFEGKRQPDAQQSFDFPEDDLQED